MMDSNFKFIWDEKTKQRAMERADVWIRHYRNHPSVVMWIASFNYFGNPVDQDPRYLGRRGWDADNTGFQRNIAASKEMMDGLKKLDPTLGISGRSTSSMPTST